MAQTPPPAAPKKVALAVDASPASRHAVAWAASCGIIPPGAALHLVSVVPTPPLPAPPGRPTLTPGPLVPAGVSAMASAGMEEYMRRVDALNAEHKALLEETAATLATQARTLRARVYVRVRVRVWMATRGGLVCV
jgi:hypothetical protein